MIMRLKPAGVQPIIISNNQGCQGTGVHTHSPDTWEVEEEPEFKDSLSYAASLRLAWTPGDCVLTSYSCPAPVQHNTTNQELGM